MLFFFFFFQAEDGIRDFHVTGVQTCALPICAHRAAEARAVEHVEAAGAPRQLDRVPPDVAGDGGGLPRPAPRQRLDLDEALELGQQAAQVARRAGARLAKRRDVDPDAHSPQSLAAASAYAARKA